MFTFSPYSSKPLKSILLFSNNAKMVLLDSYNFTPIMQNGPHSVPEITLIRKQSKSNI